MKTDVQTSSCGSGVHINISQKIDGIKPIDFKWEEIDGEKTGSIAFNFRL